MNSRDDHATITDSYDHATIRAIIVNARPREGVHATISVLRHAKREKSRENTEKDVIFTQKS